MTHKKRILFLTVSAGVFVCMLTTNIEAGAKRSVAHIVGKYAKGHPGQGRCCSGCDDLHGVYSDRNNWQDGMNDIGVTTRRYWNNWGVDGADWTDDVRRSWGGDDVYPYGTDWADAVVVLRLKSMDLKAISD